MRKGRKIPDVFNDFAYISPKQVTLSCYIKMYRQKYNISQQEMAKICSMYGEPHKVKFACCEIYNYENYKTIPSEPKFQILMNTLGITKNDL